ncbi:TPA: ead/Ea22-like family protein [Salmonella enterica subsp. enterica serovar Napoli]|nr:ead/Ea22-like family protein [Salmonella enterica subsp. enterica serovar Napoli]HBB7070145.1 ead/Ea22-like family protein [Salmonella enterica subsp. enterica serovar Napoli]
MNIDKQALREAVEKATKGPYVVGHHNINQHGNLSGVYVCQQWKDSAGGVVAECHVNCLTKTSEQVYANAEFIAVANPRTMLALLDELEHYKSREERVTKLVLDNSTSWDALYKKLEAAEKRIAEQREYYEGVIADGSKRIAELEARAVNLSKLSVGEVMHMSGFSRDYAEGWCAGNDNAIHEIRTAGIKVKGE